MTQPLSIADIALLPAPRTRIPDLRLKFIELQSIWLANGFGVAETVADERAWELMQAISGMLPRVDNPAIAGVDIEALSNDYEVLEKLFLNSAIEFEISDFQDVSFFLDKFRACEILRLHRMDPRSIILAAEEYLRTSKSEAE